MSIRTTASVISAAAGIGSAAFGIGSHALAPAAPVASATLTATQPAAATATAPGSATTTTPPTCDDGRWRGPDGINVEGRPDHFDAGDVGATYVWHDSDGWHVRTTDAARGAHHYTGTVTASAGASFGAVRPVRNERDDHIWVTADNVLHYDLTTYRGVDGFDFRVSACAADREHETLRFAMDYNGREQDTARIKLGDAKQHPPAATFTVARGA